MLQVHDNGNGARSGLNGSNTGALAGLMGTGRISKGLEDITLGMTVVKRDGRTVPFDIKRMRRALAACFNSIADAPADRDRVSDKIIRSVVGAFVLQKKREVNVEDVQRAVIAALWAEGLPAAAEHYTLYREEHRKARASKPLPQHVLDAVAADSARFPTPLQYYQFVSKFARWREDLGRRETFREACDRAMAWFRRLPKVQLDKVEWKMLDDAMFGLQAFPAMRVLQMAGPSLDRCNVGAFNCATVPIDSLRSFSELLYILMQGSGCGFSVEDEYVSKLPRIRRQRNEPVKLHVIPDTTEGWCEALRIGLDTWVAGGDITFDFSNIRAAGQRLKIKGGRSSGPEPLKELLQFARNLILGKQGKVLTSADCHRLACMTAKIVQVGGVRRSSTISLSDLDDREMRDIKRGAFYTNEGYLAMANNSAVYESTPATEVFMEEWLALVKNKSGERGIFNREAVNAHRPARRKAARFMTNPCAEVILRPRGQCNLSICVARVDDTVESLKHKVKAAAYFGTMQATATNFNYLPPEWKANCEEEALIGVDITGQQDCPLLRYDAFGREALLGELRKVVADVNTELAARFGINRAAADTTVKPSGDSGVFFDCASGIHPRYAEHQLRWVRESVHSPITKFLKSEGVPWSPAPEDPSGLVAFAFPKRAPKGAPTRNTLTAIQQLENWLVWARHWAEHAVSCSIYVGEDEWFAVGAWVLKHFDEIRGLSFFPRDNGVYHVAPNEEITEEQYRLAVATFPELNWAKLSRFEDEDLTESAQTLACVSGVCAL